MMTVRTLSLAIAATIVCLCPPISGLAAERTTIEPAEKWADVFSGGEVKFHYTVRAVLPLDGRFNWSLSVNRRTVEHGQLPLTVAAGQSADGTVAFKAPEVKEGVILESQLSVAVYADRDSKPVATHVKTVWIFPRDPFADRGQWLKGLKITLFDPQGKTADVFEKAHIPFTFTKNTDALDELPGGLLMIGEGMAWRDYRGLGEAAVKAAARGVPVLCLAPGEGKWILPGTAANMPLPSSLTLRRDDVIRELDPRLDAAAWPQGAIDACGLTIKSDHEQVVAEFCLPSPVLGRGGVPGTPGRGEGNSSSPPAWPWLEVRYPGEKAKLLICGFGLVRQWESAPAARYLFSELLLRFTAEKQSRLSLRESSATFAERKATLNTETASPR